MGRVHCVAFGLFLMTLTTTSVWAAAWTSCNGTPVRVKYPPMEISWNQCSIPEGSPQERAFFAALYDWRHYVTALGFGAGDNGQCLIDHDNNRSDIALVNRADIDGNLGFTIAETDGCILSGDESHIVTADVMIASDVSFERADESTAAGGVGVRVGAGVILHELGHALGLQHTTAFAIMRAGNTFQPKIGMTPNSGGLGYGLTGDDVYGTYRIYGSDPSYRNVFVSSQVLRNGLLRDNNLDPTRGDAVHSDPVNVCPGDKVNFYVTVGNNSSVRENLELAVYADADPNAYYFPSTGALATASFSMGRGDFSFPLQFTVSASMPSNGPEYIFVSLPTTYAWDRKGYDNTARSRLRIQRKASC